MSLQTKSYYSLEHNFIKKPTMSRVIESVKLLHMYAAFPAVNKHHYNITYSGSRL